MKRAHRCAHRVVWVVLPLVAAVILLAAWQARSKQPIPTPAVFGGEV